MPVWVLKCFRIFALWYFVARMTLKTLRVLQKLKLLPIKRSTTLGGLSPFALWYLFARLGIKMLSHFAMLRIAH
ncbi:hypothetical protein [Helicobacter bizzozeronii]|uniref:hypothetical protein n=1 Tax=Helicobacter bizzozeronii TaxID=56877 RepID=UPI000CEEEA5D|nr:hypothetical protein [Helicobacter bizzozeronii]